MEQPNVGIHHAIEFDTYKAWPLVNSGVLKWGMLSMKHMRAALDGEIESDDTTSRKFGRAAHCRLLEPDIFDIRFPIADPCEAVITTKASKNFGNPCGKASSFYIRSQWLCGTHAPKNAVRSTDFVTVDELARIDRMVESVKRHRAVSLLRSHGGTEVSFVADVFGVRVKGRADKYIPGGTCPPTIVDIKKCQVGSISLAACEKSITNYGYHRQASLYKLGLDAITGLDHHFVWVFIEEKPPYDVCVIHMDGETFAIGRHEVRVVLENWRDASESGEFIGVSDSIEQGGVTEFYRKKFSTWELNASDVNELNGSDYEETGTELRDEGVATSER